MCFGGGGDDGAREEAERARQETARREAQRQARIRHGQGIIDQNFSQFDDAYYDKYRTDYEAVKNPAIDREYAKAKDSLTAALARRGVLESTVAGTAFGDLERALGDGRSLYANEAADAANTFRKRVEQAKSDLYALNTSSADPSMIAARARGEATSLVPLQATSEIGDLFGSVLAPFVAYQRAAMYAPSTNKYGKSQSTLAPPTTGGGTGLYIG